VAARQIWKREDLERIEREEKTVAEFADEFSFSTGSIYGMRKKIRDLGIDLILERQEKRNQHYVAGGAGKPETLADQLVKVQRISVTIGGRGDLYQYVVTIPSRIGEAFVECWGRTVRFEPTEDGLMIRPVIIEAGEVPSWLTNRASGAHNQEREP
jgi:hypothetical protein